MIFGPTTAQRFVPMDREMIAEFIRNEPLWPLMTAIVKLRWLASAPPEESAS